MQDALKLGAYALLDKYGDRYFPDDKPGDMERLEAKLAEGGWWNWFVRCTGL